MGNCEGSRRHHHENVGKPSAARLRRSGWHALSPDEEDEVIRRYRLGEMPWQIAIAFKVCDTTVYNTLSRRGCRRRTRLESLRLAGRPARGRSMPLNESAFDHAEGDPVAAYFVGLMAADGCVHYRPGRARASVGLTLTETDRAAVEAFRTFLGSGHKITTTANERAFPGSRPTVTLAVDSLRLADALGRYGIGPRKSFTARVIGLEASPDFWRGVIDGDGSIYFGKNRSRNRPSISLIGSQAMVGQFRDFMVQVEPRCQASALRSKGMWQTHTSGRYAQTIIRHLYYDGCPAALPRKLALAEQADRWRAIRPDRPDLTLEVLDRLYAELGTWAKVGVAVRMPTYRVWRLRRRRAGLS